MEACKRGDRFVSEEYDLRRILCGDNGINWSSSETIVSAGVAGTALCIAFKDMEYCDTSSSAINVGISGPGLHFCGGDVHAAFLAAVGDQEFLRGIPTISRPGGVCEYPVNAGLTTLPFGLIILPPESMTRDARRLRAKGLPTAFHVAVGSSLGLECTEYKSCFWC